MFQEYIESVALEHAQTNDNENSLINVYGNTDGLDDKDVTTLVADFLLAGIDTSANSMAFLLHELAKAGNLSVQDSLHSITNGITVIDENFLKKSFGLGKSIIKESLRLHPISVGVGRILAEDAILSGYQVPKGTMIVTQNQVSSRLEEFCPYKPNDFIPERWMSTTKDKPHPFLSLPFGFGPRMCIGRRLAELSMQVLLLRMSQAFRMTTDQENLGCISYLINHPEKPLDLNLQNLT